MILFSTGGSGGGGGGVTKVNAPMDGEGVYLTFQFKVGDSVKAGDVVIEVESDKATIEVKAPSDGTIKEFFVEEQEEIDVGPSTELFSMETGGGGGAAPAAAPAAAAPAAPSGGGGGGEIVVNAPMDGEGVYLTFHKKVGDSVNAGDVVIEVESDKATIEVKAPSAGVVKEFFVPEQEEIDVGPSTQMFKMEGEGGGAAPAAPAAPAAAAPSGGGAGFSPALNAATPPPPAPHAPSGGAAPAAAAAPAKKKLPKAVEKHDEAGISTIFYLYFN